MVDLAEIEAEEVLAVVAGLEVLAEEEVHQEAEAHSKDDRHLSQLMNARYQHYHALGSISSFFTFYKNSLSFLAS